MGYRIKVAPSAAKDLLEIYRYVANEDPAAAHRLRLQLIKEFKRTADFAHLGRIVPEFRNPAIRELIRNPYRIIYLIKEKENVV